MLLDYILFLSIFSDNQKSSKCYKIIIIVNAVVFYKQY